ncbi:MAG: protein-disulfide reductase DsbD domain-containing protein [Fimbriimonadaceae bacterium]
MLLALLAFSAAHQTPTAPIPATELVAGVKACAPGKPFTVALHMKLPAGWHNYYANPGESGVPTTIAWTLPAGYVAGPIEWPLPKRIVLGGAPMYGYEGDLWLLSVITPSRTAKRGTDAVIKAKADWLLCAAECVPQSALLELKIPVGDRAVARASAGLATARKRLPQHSLPWSVSAVVAKEAIRLTVQDRVTHPVGVTFFPADPDSFTADTPIFAAAKHGFQLVVPLSRYSTKPPRRLTGILSFPATGKSYWVDTPVAS